MSEALRDRVVASFGLTPDQRRAALERARDVVVTAGAGSGKTRTLVARYASLLADGRSPREVVAVTFTEKAAREMRSRVRLALNDLLKQAVSEEERQRWQAWTAAMDSARIGTIHSLCAEILRAHPAEAGIDPKFEVLDEGITAALRVAVISETLDALVGQPEFSSLFERFALPTLKGWLAYLLDHRLEAQELVRKGVDAHKVIRKALEDRLRDQVITGCIQELSCLSEINLRQDAGDKLAAMVQELLACWRAAENALARSEITACASALYQARRDHMKGTLGGRTSRVKETVAALRTAYDELLNPLIGGKDSQDDAPCPEAEEEFFSALDLLRGAFDCLVTAYTGALCQRRALDFDDLEDGAARLLEQPEVRARWQHEIGALLVDEFQDTNERQRKIVEALAGAPGRLFVVGDARQSIYRFRRADVTVFRAIQQRVRAENGLVIDLDQTYRAHEPLLSATGDLLAPIMGITEDPFRPYIVPYSPLHAERKASPANIRSPYLEFILGAGDDTAAGRVVAARALAARLLELKQEGQVRSWDDVALLLRASSGFAPYENAFEELAIPFVTVAGRGFYDRPEIRDVLNLLRALSDPTDDLAMAGLLRSPAFGLSDTALYLLRWQGQAPAAYWAVLQGDLDCLEEADRIKAGRVVRILNELLPQVDRVPVAELLQKLVNATDYRAILAVEEGNPSTGRLWRNLDKLLGDAQASGQMNVRDFLDYLATINDAGAREGEAPAEAQGSVRLMTIHKSKGLEFPVVVLADASREPRGGSDSIYLLPKTGLALKLDPAPMLYRLAKWEDQQQNQAEFRRLLYVALTRAKDKLIINGHASKSSAGAWQTRGWMEELREAVGLDRDSWIQQAGTALQWQTSSGFPLRAWAETTAAGNPAASPVNSTPVPGETSQEPLYPSLKPPLETLESADDPPERQIWRATGANEIAPPGVIGQMVHKAIELWLFPGDAQLTPLLDAAALNAGLAFPAHRDAAIRHALEFLRRLQNHSLRAEIESARQRFHELPYSRQVNDHAETGYIDLLYETSTGWQLVDFKTDFIRSDAQRAELTGRYTRQMHKYASAVEALLKVKVQARICYLDDRGRLEVVHVS